MVTVRDIAWLAGLLEGEGCFCIAPSGSIGIQLSMTDGDVVKRAARLINTKRHGPRVRTGNRKDIYFAAIYGIPAASWMMTLWSLMGARRRQKINECLTKWRSQPVQNKDKSLCKNGHPLTGDNVFMVTQKSGRPGRRCAICHRAYFKAWRARYSSTKLARLASDSTPDVAAIGESDNRKVG